MALKVNPLTKKFDYFLHHAIASYKFAGWVTGEPANPGEGCMSFHEDLAVIFNVIDKDGHYMGYNFETLGFASDYYNFWFLIHSKRDPKVWMDLIAFGYEEITEGEGEEEHTVAVSFEIFPVFFSARYDEEEEEIIVEEFTEGEELMVFIHPTINMEAFGDMAYQSPGNVYIYGGDIGGVNLYGGTSTVWTLPHKTTTGDPSSPVERQIYVNDVDKLVRAYLDGAWRTLLDFS